MAALLLCAATLLLFSLDAAAQTQSQPGLPLNRFYPSWASDRFFSVPNPSVIGHPGIHAKVVADYGLNPLRLSETDEATMSDVSATPVRHHLHARFNGTFALFNRFAVNLDIPVALVQDGEDAALPSGNYVGASGVDAADWRIGLRARVYGEDDEIFQFGASGLLWLPVGPDDAGEYVGAGGVRGRVLLNIGGIDDRVVWAVDLGPEIGPSAVYAGIAQGSMLRYGGAVGYLLGEEKNLQLSGELYGTMVFDDPQPTNTNLELLLGAKYNFAEYFHIGAAAGPGLPVTTNIGSPHVRGVVSFGFTIEPGGGDGDKDGDGIPDSEDACPDEPGKASNNPLKNGCPRREDRDFDLIWDDEDACPDVAGVASDDPTKNGCPLDDRDGDGIPDDKDACPDKPGVKSLDFRKHGCPAAKPDKPIKDSDKDSIPNKEDACPKKPGKPNADPLKHGCPPNTRVVISGGEIKILERIEFATGRATIRLNSIPIVEQVVEVLRDNPEITKLQVQGHTDSQGPRFYNINLSDQRAKAVVDALVQRGIKRARLTAKGFGPDKPIDTNDTPEGRQKNRRVQFVILERSD